jgi:hypothetical protein
MAKETLIDRLLSGVDEVVKAAKRPLVKKQIKRAFEAAIDNVDGQLVDAQLKLQDLREAIVKNPESASSFINSIVEQQAKIDNAEKTKVYLTKEQTELFD